jgi:heme oxygenase (biliverdin-producing, ferredoxin)
MTLRLAIKDKHDQAEQHTFTKVLLSGKISPQAYGDFLFNQLFCYDMLEARATAAGLFEGLDGIERAQHISDDLEELALTSPALFQSSVDYVEHVRSLDRKQLLAHVYVRHMADMYGGQLIKKFVPTSGRYYEFANRAELISKLREMLSDDLADEANVAFDYAIDLFDEIANEHGLSAA